MRWILARLLGETYLWVDSLCIVQDDENLKQDQLQQMAAIYAKPALQLWLRTVWMLIIAFPESERCHT
jgi:hypothetical protein